MREVGDCPVVVDGVSTDGVTKMVVPARLCLYTIWGFETRIWSEFSPHTTSGILKRKREE